MSIFKGNMNINIYIFCKNYCNHFITVCFVYFGEYQLSKCSLSLSEKSMAPVPILKTIEKVCNKGEVLEVCSVMKKSDYLLIKTEIRPK